MIPKIIHYCWLSNDPIPSKLQECMNSWKKYLGKYEFFLWNLDRFNVNSLLWVKQAYKEKKYAFAADFIRLYAVYNYGGIYLDMDIEVIKPFDNLLNSDIMIGYENNLTKDVEAACFGAEINHPFIKKCLEYYENRCFIKKNGDYDMIPLPKIIRNIYENSNININYYTENYFTAKNISTGLITITENTYTVHHFNGSWLSKNEKKWKTFRDICIKIYGYKLGCIIAFCYFFFICIISLDIKPFVRILLSKFRTC